MEQLLAQSYEATQGGSQVFTMFNNADVRFPAVHDAEGKEIPLTHGNYIALLEDQNREIRKEAFENLYSVYKQFSNTLSAAFATNVKPPPEQKPSRLPAFPYPSGPSGSIRM